MSLGIILIHGYTGSSHDFQPLVDKLITSFGADTVTNLSLPGHDGNSIPEFNETLYIEAIQQSIQIFQQENRQIIMVGHSTGGSLVLATLSKYSIIPDLLILISAPQKIGLGYLERWEAHRSGRDHVPLVDIALMARFINSTGSKHFRAKFPVLIIHGQDDQLVLCNDAQKWNETVFAHFARVVTIPQAEHDIFNGTNKKLVIDIIQRAIMDIFNSNIKESRTIDSLIEVEPEFGDFFQAAPLSQHHLSICPSSQCVMGKKALLSPIAKNDPVIANIEITTYCNLTCKFCARTSMKKKSKHMPLDMFNNILSILPNIYKVVLVGLGEPLLHPQIIQFIKYAKSLKKKVGIVTNAMLLTENISKQLLDAGLDSIAFSLDGADMDLSALVRKGTDFSMVIRNIKEFVEISNATQKISKAVFSAVSTDTISRLTDLIDRVSDLGVDVLMLTDINFKSNLGHTLWKNMTPDIESAVKKAISYAFSKNLPVLSVHGLEEFGLEKRFHDFLMIPPGQLYQRSSKHTWCYSPWQTLPIDVEGNITLCDCHPELVIGNLLKTPFSEIWNGEIIKKYRSEMLSDNPPESCKICPRF